MDALQIFRVIGIIALLWFAIAFSLWLFFERMDVKYQRREEKLRREREIRWKEFCHVDCDDLEEN